MQLYNFIKKKSFLDTYYRKIIIILLTFSLFFGANFASKKAFPNSILPSAFRVRSKHERLPQFQFWNGHEIPRGLFYLFLGIPTKSARASFGGSGFSREQRIVFLTASRYCTLSTGEALVSKFPRYPSFMSRTLKRNMNGLRAPVRYTSVKENE